MLNRRREPPEYEQSKYRKPAMEHRENETNGKTKIVNMIEIMLQEIRNCQW